LIVYALAPANAYPKIGGYIKISFDLRIEKEWLQTEIWTSSPLTKCDNSDTDVCGEFDWVLVSLDVEWFYVVLI
jgi:hypothetical protein